MLYVKYVYTLYRLHTSKNLKHIKHIPVLNIYFFPSFTSCVIGLGSKIHADTLKKVCVCIFCKYFLKLRELRDTCQALKVEGLELNDLSMGMTSDYKIAIEEGATLVRVGSAIFGSRS